MGKNTVYNPVVDLKPLFTAFEISSPNISTIIIFTIFKPEKNYNFAETY